MDKCLALVQQVQDVFAAQTGLTWVLMDTAGTMATSPSGSNRLNRQIREAVHYMDWLHRLTELSVIDVYPGLKSVIAPIRILGVVQYYLCAGVMLEHGSRGLLYEYLESNARSEWIPEMEKLQEVSDDEKRRLIDRVRTAAETMEAMLNQARQERGNRRFVEGIRRLSGLTGSEHSLREMIGQLLQTAPELEFAGFASRVADECTITELCSEFAWQALEGARFAVGEGFIGQVMVTGMAGNWNQIRNDPRTVLFRRNGLTPQALICCPVIVDHEILGVLFGGTCSGQMLDPLTVDIGMITANLIRSYLMHQHIRDTHYQALQRLNALMEISRLIVRAQDPKKIAILLVDMSLNILQGSFAAITLFNEGSASEEVRIVSRGLTAVQSDLYGKLLLRHYRGQTFDGSFGMERVRPYSRQLEWGIEVMECPLYNQGFHGILSVALDPKDEDGQSFLASLATIGALALSRMNAGSNPLSQRIADLHEAVRQWDPDAHENARSLQEQALLFAEHAGLSAAERQGLEYAGLLSPYHPDIVGGIWPNDSLACRIHRGFSDLKIGPERRSASDGPAAYELGSQILKLVFDSMNHQDKRAPLTVPDGIDPELHEKYRAYLLRSQVLDRQVTDKPPDSPRIEGLSKREQEVLRLIVQGLNNKQIAAALFISEHTVKNHITNIFQKLGTVDRAGLIAYFYQQIGN